MSVCQAWVLRLHTKRSSARSRSVSMCSPTLLSSTSRWPTGMWVLPQGGQQVCEYYLKVAIGQQVCEYYQGGQQVCESEPSEISRSQKISWDFALDFVSKRLENRERERKNLDLVSKNEIRKEKLSIMSRKTRFSAIYLAASFRW